MTSFETVRHSMVGTPQQPSFSRSGRLRMEFRALGRFGVASEGNVAWGDCSHNGDI